MFFELDPPERMLLAYDAEIVSKLPPEPDQDGWFSLRATDCYLPPLGVRCLFTVLITDSSGYEHLYVGEGMRKQLADQVIAIAKEKFQYRRDWYWAVPWSDEGQLLAWRHWPEPYRPPQY